MQVVSCVLLAQKFKCNLFKPNYSIYNQRDDLALLLSMNYKI